MTLCSSRQWLRAGTGFVTAVLFLWTADAAPVLARPAPRSTLQPASSETWRLERVVVVMRHGVRPPTKAEPLPASIPHQPWPVWDVGWGELTHHGEQAIARVAQFDAATYAPLLGPGCPAPGAVRAVADSDQRTVRTAQVYVATMFPGCAVPIEHKEQGESDPRFSPFEGPALLPAQDELAAAEAALPTGGLPALDRQFAPQLAALDRIVACGSADCALATRPGKLSVPGGKVKVGGGLGTGAMLSEALALEYAEGKPMDQVGWGRADRATITDLLSMHAQEFALIARPRAIAAPGARLLLREVAQALYAPDAPRFSLLLGHDTNLALIGGALGLHWHAAQFAPDDPPPGGALIFERWRSGAGRLRLAVRFRSQTLDEMRELSPLTGAAVSPVAFAPCGGTQGCPSAQWSRTIAEALDTAAPNLRVSAKGS